MRAKMLVHWKKISEKTVYGNNHWTYKLDEFEIPNRSRGEYHYVHTNGSTLIIPLLPSGKILLVNQYRYLIDDEALEFPCGVLEENLSPEENARKELREETGYDAEELAFAGGFVPYSGVSDETTYVYIAKNLFENPLPSDDTEEFELVELTVRQIDEMISANEIKDGMTLAAWALAKPKIIETEK